MQVNSQFNPINQVGVQGPIQGPAQGPGHCHQGGGPAPVQPYNQQQFQNLHQGYTQLSQGWQQLGGQGFAPVGGGQAFAQGGFAPSAPNGSRPRVAVIDDFQSGHGPQMERLLNQSGVDTMRFNVNAPGQNRTTLIANALQDVAARLDRGEDIDAINLSQQDFGAGPDTQRIQQLVAYIQQRHGVPVVVAAGNGGPGATNQLAQGAALVASSAVGDFQQGSSGLGNILQEAGTTSEAAALVAARAALLRNQGLGLGQIVGGLQQQARFEGGALNG